MSSVRSFRLLSLFLTVSVAVNIWQFLRDPPPDEGTGQKTVASFFAWSQPDTGRLPERKTSAEPHDEQDSDPPARSAALMPLPEHQTEDELVFGASGIAGGTPVHGEPSGKISPQRLKELAAMPVSQAGRFQVHARLFLPGDRMLDLGTYDFAAGHRIKFERLKEFPFPTSVALARVGAAASPFGREGESLSPEQGSLSVTPTTPADFEFQNRGLEIELDLTPAAGSLVIGGSLRQTVFEGFGRMPGEAFSPIGHDDEDLTDNKLLQPQFTTRESPFVAAATEGQPVRIPVLTSFGQTFLEITCRPLE